MQESSSVSSITSSNAEAACEDMARGGAEAAPDGKHADIIVEMAEDIFNKLEETLTYEEVAKMVGSLSGLEKQGSSISFQMWDFGGQLVFYTLHHFFFPVSAHTLYASTYNR